VSFVDAKLEGANFEGADLDGANLSSADLGGAIWVDGRICGPASVGACR
jgi:uncharacterized protein YjbI with pentapeptide repeats